MWLPNWLRSSKHIAVPSSQPGRRGKAPTTRLFLEPLEDRTLPSAGWAIDTGGSGTVNTLPKMSQPDAAGNFYVTGYFTGTVTFGSTTLTATTNNSSFVAKVDPNGNFLWAEQFGGLSAGSWTGIAQDSNDNVYLSGDFDGTQSFGGIPLTSTGPNATGYICKVDSNGNFLWAQRFAYQTSGSYSEALAVDGNGNPYLSWWANSPNGTVGFLSRYDTSGNSLWTQQLANNLTGVSAWSVTTDASDNAYVGGVGAGSNFLTKYDPTGVRQWSQQQAGAGSFLSDALDPTGTWLYAVVGNTLEKIDAGSGAVNWTEQVGSPGVRPTAVAVDASGNLYLAGGFGTGSYDFDPGPGVATLTVQSGAIFVLKLDASGNFLSVRDFAGPNASANVLTIGLDSSGNIYTAGQFSGTLNFDTGSQTVQLTSSGSNRSLFLAKTTQDTGMIFGRVFNDLNNNGVFDAGSLESGLPNVTVYLDLNNSGSYIAGDPTTVTDSQGYFNFNDLTPGNYTVRQIIPSGYTGTPASFTVSVTAGLGSETTGFADFTPNKTRTYSNTSAVKTSKGKPNALSSLTVPDTYTVLGATLTLNVSNPNNNSLSIYLTEPNGTKVSIGSTNQNGTLTYQVPNFEYTSVKGTWKLEVDGLAGGTLKSWSLSIDGTLS